MKKGDRIVTRIGDGDKKGDGLLRHILSQK